MLTPYLGFILFHAAQLNKDWPDTKSPSSSSWPSPRPWPSSTSWSRSWLCCGDSCPPPWGGADQAVSTEMRTLPLSRVPCRLTLRKRPTFWSRDDWPVCQSVTFFFFFCVQGVGGGGGGGDEGTLTTHCLFGLRVKSVRRDVLRLSSLSCLDSAFSLAWPFKYSVLT